MYSIGEVFMDAATKARQQGRITVKTFNGYAGTWGKIQAQRAAAAKRRKANAEQSA